MSFLLDTNIVSELIKPGAATQVLAWVDQLAEEDAYLSVTTFAEVRRGVEIMDPGRRRDSLKRWADDELPTRFAGRILLIDRPVAETWGVVVGRAKRLGRPISAMDTFIAATAEAHGLTLATRNVSHFAPLGIPIFDPWSYLP